MLESLLVPQTFPDGFSILFESPTVTRIHVSEAISTAPRGIVMSGEETTIVPDVYAPQLGVAPVPPVSIVTSVFASELKVKSASKVSFILSLSPPVPVIAVGF